MPTDGHPLEPPRAVHGGDFFQALGDDFADLWKRESVVSADVLDAWYDPSPLVMEALSEHLSWLVRTSPPTHAEGLRRTIAQARNVPEASVLVGPGTSSLMFQVLPTLLKPGGKLLVLDPMYGEYAHLGEHVCGATVVRHELPLDTFLLDIDALVESVRSTRPDVVAIVNPNSPTGRGVAIEDIERLLTLLPDNTRLWIDETYIDFFTEKTSREQSAERLVANDPRLIVCKSLSKFYALSGLRAGYLVADPALVLEVSRTSPPWNLGMIAQLAAVKALGDDAYYSAKAAETRRLADDAVAQYAAFDWCEPVPTDTNFLLLRLKHPVAAELVAYAAERQVFVRDCGSLSPRFENETVRVAVKGSDVDRQVAEVLNGFFASRWPRPL